jgi:nucleotide-binding universal stress UspA family protein
MKRILVAVDTTSSAPVVVRHAVELARAIGGKVRLFHAVTMPKQVPPPGVFVAPPALHVQELVSAAQRALEGLSDAVPEELRDGAMVDVGQTPERLCEAAHTYDPDVVVIGAHEYGLVARALGTNAARIVNRMDRPVLVVRPLPASHVVSMEPSRASAQ